MPDFRQSNIPGGCYIFTVVAYHRLPILTPDQNQAFIEVRAKYPFNLDAICLLPEHIHSIWTLPEQDSNYSVRWKEIKHLFTRDYLTQVRPGEPRSASRQVRGEAAVWQRRFWERSIRGEGDLNWHLDYLHFNPVKHGLVERTVDWPWSSFHRFVKMGFYEKDWGADLAQEVLDLECGE